MTDEKLVDKLKSLSGQLGIGEKTIIRFLEAVNPGEYTELHRSLFNEDASIKEYDHILRTEKRLELLAKRLNDEGRYVDANICWLAHDLITSK
ncbi:hypothetical protein PHIM7_136 [Sinorhizobium phage phiM7]|uniref:Uncharacterized protein n=2 Tax=Emdodecavirus TaxID=1980937 RepID=S5M6Y7_9CAUD|nr:hypothetical protein AB690_gp361 [Sinorhizobium phage phiM12]YP_009601261.1 hypothetical protein FDH46_gp342 [Sinorhizobium phage phiM7]AGR47831.2 hypothetical protein SmphiM12_199 [Sinorhizobium phage phiM12]AKF12682.1 hypothetical protein PHIM7_136 [Sinorhizobium phage phiM7]AKF13041.1 hypothetical protein PHIM19_136 [Sinorhizobium phage phiM19]